MGDEQDSWFKPFGFDPGTLAQAAKEKIVGEVQEVKQEFQKAETAVRYAAGLSVQRLRCLRLGSGM